MRQSFYAIDNDIDKASGFVWLKGKQWDIIDSCHAEQRSGERALNIDSTNLVIAMLADQLDASPKMLKAVLSLGMRGEEVFFRDDVNDVAMVLRFDPANRRIVLVTCWSQLRDRQILGRAHSSLKPGFNIHANRKDVRLVRCYEDGSRKTILRDENWEILEVDDIHIAV